MRKYQDTVLGAGTSAIPRSLQVSFWLWMATAALYLIGAIVHYPANAAPTEEQLHAAATAGPASTAAAGIALAVVCVRCAFKVRSGRNWARITLTLVTTLRVVSVAISFSPLAAVVAATTAAATALLFLPDANRYFAAVNQSAGDR